MEELYRALYSKYAGDLSQEEIDTKIGYALQQDPSNFVNTFYQKYTGGGPSQDQLEYINSILPEIELPEQEQKEEDTAIERALGKNVVTDFFGDLYRAGEQGLAQGATVDEAFDVYKKGKNISDEELRRYIEVSDALDKTGASDEMREYEEIKNEAGGGVWGFMKGMVMTRGQVIPQVIVSSAAAMGRTFFDSEEAAAAAGGGAAIAGTAGSFVPVVGTATGAIGGAVAGLTGSMETALTLTELLKTELGDKDFNKENIRAILEDEELFEDIKDRALARGATIGAVEGITVGLSRGVGAKLLKSGASKGKIARQVTGIETLGGSGGEALGQVAAGQEFDIAEVLMEGIAEAKGVVNVADILAKKEYKINGEKRTRKEVLDKVANTKAESLAKIQFEVTGDKNLDNLVKEKQAEAVFETQIDERVGETDRKKLVELERKRQKAEADTKKKGVFAVPDAETTLENIENEINSVIDKYANVDRRTSDVKARKKVAGEVRTEVAERVFQGNMAFAKKHSELYGLKFTELTQEEIKKRFKGDKKNLELADSLGGIIGDEIIINKDLAKTRVYGDNVGNHELLHGIIKASGQQKNITQETINDFLNIIGEENKAKIQERIDKNYTPEYMAENLDEYFTIFSDAIANNEVKFNDSVFTKIADVIRRMFASVGLAKVDFKSGRGAYNFLKDYNKSIHKGSLSSGTARATKGDGTSETLKTSKAPETLIKTIKRGGNPRQVAAAEDALVPQYQALALEALGYKEAKGDIRRENVVSAINEYYDAVVRNYDPKKGAFSTHVYNNIAPKNDTIFEKAKTLAKRDESISLDAPEAMQIADTTETTDKGPDTRRKKTNVLKIGKVERKADAIKKIVKVKPGDTFKEVSDNNTGKVAEEIFDVPASKITDPKKNLTYAKKIVNGIPEASEAGNIQNFYSDTQTAEKVIKILPTENVTASDADINEIGENIDVDREVLGRGLGLTNRMLNYFYNKTDKRSKGKTSQPFIWELKSEFKNPTPETIKQFQEDLGITPRGELNNYNRNIGQLLKGVAKFQAQQTSLSTAQRILTEQKKATKKQIASITVAQSKVAFSKSSELLSKYQLGELSKPLGIKLTPLIQIQKEGKDKIYTSQRDVDAQFTINGKKTGKTYKETAAQALNLFLEKNPQFRDLIQKTMTGGVLRAGFFQTVEEFNKVVNKVTAEQKTYAKDPYNKNKFLDKKFVNKTKEKGYKKGQDGKLPLLLDFFLAVENHLKNNPLDIWVFEEMLKDTGKHQNTITRILAPITAYPVNQKGDAIYDQKVVEEHTNPQNQIGKALLANAQIGNTKKMWKVIGKSYMQLSLLKADDNLINESGYQTSMPDIYYDEIVPRLLDGSLKLPDGLVSVVRLAKSGIDLNNYYLINEGKTIAEFFGVEGMEVSRANEQVVKQLTGEVDIKFSKSLNKVNVKPQLKETKTLNKAIVLSRSTQKESKGITVLDFDDTLATTKSGVRAKIPNTDGLPKPQRKVIFLAGGAGSGKGNVISKLGLKDQGFKIVNSDISLEWLKKNSGLPANMNDFTKEQRSKLGSLQHQARGIAKRKMMKYQGNANGVVVDGTGGSIKSMEKLVNEFKDKGYDVSMMFVETSLPVALERNAARKERSLLDKIVTKNHEAVQGNKDGFKTMFGDRFMEVNTDKLGQQDAMPTELTDKMNDFVSGYENRRLDAEEFASEGADILEQGGTFDFSEFNKVVEGQKAPLFEKAMKLQKKFGNKDMFVLTARPAESAPHIHEFLKANGLNIPLKNITGLANSTSEAKALWMADKVGEGFNDFYFADDALQNVQAVKNMLDQFDVKSKVQQAKVKFSKSMDQNFNDILENITGIESKKRFSAIKARKRGESKGKFRFFIPPSHEDFVGLLYNFMGRGKEGNAHRDFFEKALIRPLNRAYRELNAAKQAIANDYKALNKQFENVKKKLTKKTPDGDFTYQDAIRVYLWNKHGNKIPGLSPTDQQNLVDLVMGDPELQAYAETLNVISKQEKYVAPTESWEGGDIRTDLDDATGRIGRGDFFAEFNENVDTIFSQENLNKIEAAYGADVVSAIKDMVYRIKTGQNRPSGQNKQTNQWLNYLNGSVAATMFFNVRSAVLQQMSLVNFINFADNNIIAAAKAFANQKQYWADWATIFNSDFMRQRRKGIQTDVNGAELAASVKGAKNPAQAVIKKLLELGFLPTQIGDNIAIATGGATFLRNRINTYLKEGMSKKEAEAKAFVDFEILAEATQQSARPDMVSQQQASPLGKVILAFQNVTSQFNRLGKKAFLDIKNRRITPGNTTQMQSDMSNLSRIAYYFAIQNVIFYSLQSALFMAMFDDDEDDKRMLAKKERIVNGTLDSVLRGAGVWGAAISTLKNMAFAYHKERAKDWNGDEASVLVEALNVSPPLGIKARKIVNAERTLNYNRKTIDEMETFDIDNPQWSANTSYIEALTNVPLNRLYNKTMNVRESLNNQQGALERVLMFSGWSKWNLGVEDVEKEKKKQKFSNKKKTKGRGTLKVY